MNLQKTLVLYVAAPAVAKARFVLSAAIGAVLIIFKPGSSQDCPGRPGIYNFEEKVTVIKDFLSILAMTMIIMILSNKYIPSFLEWSNHA